MNHADKVLGIIWNDLGGILIFDVKDMFKMRYMLIGPNVIY